MITGGRRGKPTPVKRLADHCRDEGCAMARDGMSRCGAGKCIDGLSLALKAEDGDQGGESEVAGPIRWWCPCRPPRRPPGTPRSRRTAVGRSAAG
jgi:hypothetical protein